MQLSKLTLLKAYMNGGYTAEYPIGRTNRLIETSPVTLYLSNVGQYYDLNFWPYI